MEENNGKNPGDFFRKLLKSRIFLITAGAFIIVLGILYYTFFWPNYYEGDGPRRFDIEEGEPFVKVIERLEDEGIIPSKTNMRIAAFIYGAETKIKAGRYNIPDGMSYLDLLDMFIEGKTEKKILIDVYPGISIDGLAYKMDAQGICEIDSVKNLITDPEFHDVLDFHQVSLEGYLMPDDYAFYKNSSADEVLLAMYTNFDDFVTDSMINRADKMGYTLHQVVTLASIVEAETNLAGEMATVAGVYYNRLRIGMKLQADPTVQYALPGGWKKRLLQKHLTIDSPYNTYKYYGLPPGPINNPGRNALLAAFFPEDHDYLYFVANPEGGHLFSKTLREHLRKAREYHTWLNALEKQKKMEEQQKEDS